MWTVRGSLRGVIAARFGLPRGAVRFGDVLGGVR
jgi:hypothetical protein